MKALTLFLLATLVLTAEDHPNNPPSPTLQPLVVTLMTTLETSGVTILTLSYSPETSRVEIFGITPDGETIELSLTISVPNRGSRGWIRRAPFSRR